MCNFATSSGYDRGQKIIDKGVDVFGTRIEFLDDPRFYAVKIPKIGSSDRTVDIGDL